VDTIVKTLVASNYLPSVLETTAKTAI